MKSWKIARFAGIDVSVHWTFLLLLAWVAFQSMSGGILAVASALLMVVAVFTCVVLHEYGHALAARQFGIGTRGITLLPIGGVANLEGIPRNPLQELWVAVAGPLVNVVIAFLLAVLFPSVLSGGAPQVVGNLFYINVALVLFNLVPAFPMDGGRIFRAIMAMWLPYEKATRLAATVGKIAAVALALLGIFVVNNPMLLFVAAFVVLAGDAEARFVEHQSRSRQASRLPIVAELVVPGEPPKVTNVTPYRSGIVVETFVQSQNQPNHNNESSIFRSHFRTWDTATS